MCVPQALAPSMSSMAAVELQHAFRFNLSGPLGELVSYIFVLIRAGTTEAGIHSSRLSHYCCKVVFVVSLRRTLTLIAVRSDSIVSVGVNIMFLWG